MLGKIGQESINEAITRIFEKGGTIPEKPPIEEVCNELGIKRADLMKSEEGIRSLFIQRIQAVWQAFTDSKPERISHSISRSFTVGSLHSFTESETELSALQEEKGLILFLAGKSIGTPPESEYEALLTFTPGSLGSPWANLVPIDDMPAIASVEHDRDVRECLLGTTVLEIRELQSILPPLRADARYVGLEVEVTGLASAEETGAIPPHTELARTDSETILRIPRLEIQMESRGNIELVFGPTEGNDPRLKQVTNAFRRAIRNARTYEKAIRYGAALVASGMTPMDRILSIFNIELARLNVRFPGRNYLDFLVTVNPKLTFEGIRVSPAQTAGQPVEVQSNYTMTLAEMANPERLLECLSPPPMDASRTVLEAIQKHHRILDRFGSATKAMFVLTLYHDYMYSNSLKSKPRSERSKQDKYHFSCFPKIAPEQIVLAMTDSELDEFKRASVMGLDGYRAMAETIGIPRESIVLEMSFRRIIAAQTLREQVGGPRAVRVAKKRIEGHYNLSLDITSPRPSSLLYPFLMNGSLCGVWEARAKESENNTRLLEAFRMEEDAAREFYSSRSKSQSPVKRHLPIIFPVGKEEPSVRLEPKKQPPAIAMPSSVVVSADETKGQRFTPRKPEGSPPARRRPVGKTTLERQSMRANRSALVLPRVSFGVASSGPTSSKERKK